MFPVAMYFFVYIVLAYVHLYTYDIYMLFEYDSDVQLWVLAAFNGLDE